MHKPPPAPEAPVPAGQGEAAPEQAPDESPEGSNATIHHPDPDAEQHPVRPDRKTRFPYTTGNY